jgi:hypothetical protein
LLNRSKCKVLVVSRRPFSGDSIAGIPVVQELPILGLLYTGNGSAESNLQARAKKGRTKTVMHVSRLCKSGCQHDLKVASLMLNCDVRPTLLYGAGMWGFHRLAYQDPVEHILQVQHWILRDFCRLWSRLLVAGDTNKWVCECLVQQLFLLEKNKRCWLRSWHKALQKLSPALAVHSNARLPRLMPLDETVVTNALCCLYQSRLNSMGNPFSPAPCEHRRIAFVWKCVSRHYKWGVKPTIMHTSVPLHVRPMWWQFLAANSRIPVHDYALCRELEFHQRLCTKCNAGKVSDEAHILLGCVSTSMVRSVFRSKLYWKRTLPELLVANCSNADLAHFTCQALQAYLRANTVAA